MSNLIMHRSLVAACCVATSLTLAACGTTPGDRAVSGGALGAGVGGLIGAVTGHTVAGLVIGGVLGAATGALTDPCSLNLGDPVWKNKHASRADYYHRCGHYPPR